MCGPGSAPRTFWYGDLLRRTDGDSLGRLRLAGAWALHPRRCERH